MTEISTLETLRLRDALRAIRKEAFLATSSPTQLLLADRVRTIEKMADDALAEQPRGEQLELFGVHPN